MIFVQVLIAQELDEKVLITRNHDRGKVKETKLNTMHVQGATGSGTREVKASDENSIIDWNVRHAVTLVTAWIGQNYDKEKSKSEIINVS